MRKQPQEMMDAVLVGSIEWDSARKAAFDMANGLRGEIAALEAMESGIKDAYSPIAWLNICRQLRVVTDGMIVMRMLADGKSNQEVTAATGILPGSIAAYKAWNTMYAASVQLTAKKRIVKLKGRNAIEQSHDAEFLRSCGIAFSLQPRPETHNA